MKAEHKEILVFLEKYLENKPWIRFGQALFNLQVNQFEEQDKKNPLNFRLRDIYNDSDAEILSRIKSSENFK